MSEKMCRKCGELKCIDLYYVHKQMGDGHLNICKECTKSRVIKRGKELKKDPEYAKRERERGRLKYHRLNYRGKNKPSRESKKATMKRYKEKFPEKAISHNLSSHIKKAGYEKHHWSYQEENAKSAVFLATLDHMLVHRYTTYDQERMMYRNDQGTLIDSVESVNNLLRELSIKDFEWYEKKRK